MADTVKSKSSSVHGMVVFNEDGSEIGQSLPTAGNNPVIKLHTNASGDLVKVEKIINGTTYTKTTDVADQVITKVVTYSVWS